MNQSKLKRANFMNTKQQQKEPLPNMLSVECERMFRAKEREQQTDEEGIIEQAVERIERFATITNYNEVANAVREAIAAAQETAAERDRPREQVRELLVACKRIAFEPQGKASASHAEVLQSVENIAKAAIANVEGKQ